MKYLLGLILVGSVSFAQVLESEYRALSNELKMAYEPELRENSLRDGYEHKLFINENDGYDSWATEFKQGSYVGFYDDYEGAPIHKHIVSVFGAMARQPYLEKEGLAFILCHEMGHGFSKGPQKEGGDSVEGEADYYAPYCLGKLIAIGSLKRKSENKLSMDLCKARFAHGADKYESCLIKMSAIEQFKIYLETDYVYKSKVQFFDVATLLKRVELIPVPKPSYNSNRDFYPNAQCRLESALHGALELSRPPCW